MRTLIGLKGARAVLPWAALALLSASLVVGCGKKPEEETPVTPLKGPAKTQATAPSGEAIKIGAIFSVSGRGAPLGEPEKKTAEMLEEQINAKGGVLGRPIEIIIKDNKTETQETVIAAKDLMENEQVVAIVGTSDTPTTMAIKDMCEKATVPLVSCAAGKTITDPIASFVFAVPQTNALTGEKMCQVLTKKGIKSIAMLSVDNAFGKDGAANTEAAAEAAGIKVVDKQAYGPDDTDMTAQLTKIKAASPEAIVIWGTNPGPAIATKNAKTLGITVPIIQSHGVANAKFLELAGDAANGVELPAGRPIVVDQIADDDPQKELLTQFAKDFEAKYSSKPDTFAGHAYDAINLVVKGLEAAGEVDRAKLRDAIEATQKFVGTAGIFNYSATDHNGLTVDAFVWVKIEEGKWKLAE